VVTKQIRDLRVAEREEDIGFYAGFLGTLLLVTPQSSVLTQSHPTQVPNKWLTKKKKAMRESSVLLSPGAAYMIGRGVASVFWGVVADRVGRKPVIAFSVLSV
jgi:MFS family permease